MYQLITAKDDGTDPIIIKLNKKPPTFYDIEPKKVLDNIYTIPYGMIGGWAYSYARYVIKGRWVEGEEAIKRSGDWAYYYAINVIGGRWVEGEEAIKRSSEWAYFYAKDVIGGRWVEGEEDIKRDNGWWKEYQETVYNVESHVSAQQYFS